jgi:drug/metabolite transporter (DMT)-like permease
MSRVPSGRPPSNTGNPLPVLALLASATLWGGSWYPFRVLEEHGVSGLWGVMGTQMVAAMICLMYFGRQLFLSRWTVPVLAIGLFGGICNTSYVMGTIEGEVMRTTLLLYMSPLWTILLARWLLHEPLNLKGVGVVTLSLCGAMLILWPWGAGTTGFGPGDVWGVIAGISFATYNVLIRRHLEIPIALKTFVVMFGTALVALAAMLLVDGHPMHKITSFSGAIILSIGLMLVLNVSMQQYGLERLSAVRASVIMMSELVFATLFAWWWAHEVPGLRELMGGMFIVVAGLLSSLIVPPSAMSQQHNLPK